MYNSYCGFVGHFYSLLYDVFLHDFINGSEMAFDKDCAFFFFCKTSIPTFCD